MMTKYFIVFGIGILETALYTGFLIALEKRRNVLAPILMFVYMTIYLALITACIKDVAALSMIITYAFSCGIGVFIRMQIEKRLNTKTEPEIETCPKCGTHYIQYDDISKICHCLQKDCEEVWFPKTTNFKNKYLRATKHT